jgi:D-alanine-D-alanine ligase
MGRVALAVGIVYETFETYQRRASEPDDAQAEYEPESTIAVLEAAVARLGHRALRLGSPHEVLARLASGLSSGGGLGVDVALNIAEGFGSRNREAWAPVILEMAGVPTLGSDALTLSLSLDKLWTNRTVAEAGVPVPPQVSLADPEKARDLDLTVHGLAFPLFVKPRWEGSAKGIRASSRVEDRGALVREVARVVTGYGEPALVECFLPGAEYTVVVVGNDPPRALPVLQRALEAESGIGLHALEAHGANAESRAHHLPGDLTADLEARLQDMALTVWRVLDCLDFARCDFRLDASGEPAFLEINPLPTFAVDGSFAILAELEGRSLEDLLADVLAAGLRRLGLPERADTREAAAR